MPFFKRDPLEGVRSGNTCFPLVLYNNSKEAFCSGLGSFRCVQIIINVTSKGFSTVDNINIDVNVKNRGFFLIKSLLT